MATPRHPQTPESAGFVDAPRLVPLSRQAYARHVPITTRWMDNDIYGHVNNVVYYSFFDTAVNQSLMEVGLLDPQHGSVIGLVVQTQCHYFAPIAFPQQVTAGVRVARIGRSSVRYEVGLFADDSPQTAAHGHFVHVYVDRRSRRPVALTASMRSVLSAWARP